MLEFAIRAFITFLVVIDPVGMVPVFIALTAGRTSGFRYRTARRAIVIAAMTLIVFAVAGDAVFHFLGISIPAFEIAGGLLLLLLSIDMILVRHSGLRTATETETDEASESADVAVFPLAVPLIAGPGAMTSVVLLIDGAQGNIARQIVAIVLLLIVLGLCLMAFLLSSKLVERLGKTGINVIGRVFGIVLAGLAVQYILDGLAVAFPALLSH